MYWAKVLQKGLPNGSSFMPLCDCVDGPFKVQEEIVHEYLQLLCTLNRVNHAPLVCTSYQALLVFNMWCTSSQILSP
jgi:hypothetical protein